MVLFPLPQPSPKDHHHHTLRRLRRASFPGIRLRLSVDQGFLLTGGKDKNLASLLLFLSSLLRPCKFSLAFEEEEMAHDQPWVFAVGILGNIISFMVYLAPLPTFYRVYRKKSTEGFQSVPYVVALFSAMLWIYYALLKTSGASLLITINAIGCFIESGYLIMFLIYAPKSAKLYTVKLVSLMNIGVYGLVLLLTMQLSKGSRRAIIVGWICVGCSVCVFVAPLSVIRLVIRTRSVDFMPFSLSCSLTVSAIVWFLYGLLTKDRYVALPNILGFGFGIVQMILYIIYKDVRQINKEISIKAPEHVITIPCIAAVPGSEFYPINSTSDGREEKVHEHVNGAGEENIGGQEGVELTPCEV